MAEIFAISNSLKTIRKQKGWTQEKLCNELKKHNCCLNRSTYSRYETGERIPPPEIIVALSKCFGATINCILGLSDYVPYASVKFCKNSTCIFCFYKQCLLDSVSIDENGCCNQAKFFADDSDKAFIEEKIFLRVFYE